MSAKISIIFPMLNGSPYLKRNLDSIKKLKNNSDIELIIVNNNSNDSSVEIINSYKDSLSINVINQKENIGFAKASNIGVLKAKGEFIFITNVDVIFPTNLFFEKLNAMYEKYKKTNEIIISPAMILERGGIHYFGAKIHALGFSYTKEIFKELPENIITKPTLRFSGGSFFMKRDAFISLGGFDQNFFIYYEDTDFSLRSIRNNMKIYSTQDPYLIHQDHELKLNSFKYYLLERNRFLFFAKNIEGFKKLIPYFLIVEFILLIHSILIRKFKFRIIMYCELIKNYKNIKRIRQKSRNEIKLIPFQKLSRKLDPCLIGDMKNKKFFEKFLNILNYFLKLI
ncbi:MAG: glycosyltransferase family 2 protein [Promethearchaeota archaeon]